MSFLKILKKVSSIVSEISDITTSLAAQKMARQYGNRLSFEPVYTGDILSQEQYTVNRCNQMIERCNDTLARCNQAIERCNQVIDECSRCPLKQSQPVPQYIPPVNAIPVQTMPQPQTTECVPYGYSEQPQPYQPPQKQPWNPPVQMPNHFIPMVQSCNDDFDYSKYVDYNSIPRQYSPPNYQFDSRQITTANPYIPYGYGNTYTNTNAMWNNQPRMIIPPIQEVQIQYPNWRDPNYRSPGVPTGQPMVNQNNNWGGSNWQWRYYQQPVVQVPQSQVPVFHSYNGGYGYLENFPKVPTATVNIEDLLIQDTLEGHTEPEEPKEEIIQITTTQRRGERYGNFENDKEVSNG